ncbi:hypothetical protein IH779_00320 [Patescibacteria group bacterium]|nr:hypothetical protein [Patescibacteria group bacterium]
MKFHFQKYKKFIFLLSILVLLLFAFTFPYNKEEGTLAQGEVIWDCGEEIPIGEALDEAIVLVNTVTSNADQMLSRGGQQVASAYTIHGLDLPNECKAENCQAGCDVTYHTECTTNEHCGSSCPPGESCTEEEICLPFLGAPLCSTEYCWQETTCQQVSQCNISPCTGDACDPALMAEAAANVSQISALYPLILANEAAINAAIATRPGIIAKLEAARTALEQCALPASGYVAGETVQLIETIVTCENAKFYKILPAGQDCSNPRNFFCCRPRTP